MRKKIKTKNKFCFGSEFEYAITIWGFPKSYAAKICCRDMRTIDDWISGKRPCPAWALRLVMLESRHMDALYGLQRDRSTGFAEGMRRIGMGANDAVYSTQMALALVK